MKEKPQTDPAKAPKTLSREAAKWWWSLVFEYELNDEAGLLLLQTSLEAFDRMREAQQQIASDGLIVADRFGQLKAHPAAAIERDARAQMLTALKALNCDLEPQRDMLGRPPVGRKP